MFQRLCNSSDGTLFLFILIDGSMKFISSYRFDIVECFKVPTMLISSYKVEDSRLTCITDLIDRSQVKPTG